ncbi:MAG TPA: hypothetical protein VF629_22180 [Hymenobacter sp.]|uniref:hypothetical protein n=1 Tax=Hymenobacter sp. TaxID=1898978 RepID=UPI002EDA66F7
MPDLLAEITQAAKAYYAQAAAFPLTPTDFQEWLESLPPARRAEALARGFVASQAEPHFLHFCLEWRGYNRREFMARHLSVAAFELWATHGGFDGDLPPHGLGR